MSTAALRDEVTRGKVTGQVTLPRLTAHVYGATIAAAIKKALNQAEQHLWQAELAAAVAAAIDKVPTPVQESAVGSLAGNPNYRKRLGVRRRCRATALTRWQESGVL